MLASVMVSPHALALSLGAATTMLTMMMTTMPIAGVFAQQNVNLDIMGQLRRQGNYTTLVRLLESTGLSSSLQQGSGGSAVTLLSPNDQAFSILPSRT